MDITRQPQGEVLILRAKGRLDAYWATHLGSEISDVLRQGARRIVLNLKEVPYISSAGIRVLLHSHKQLKSIDGSFAVTEPSREVKAVLDLAGVTELLVGGSATSEAYPAEATNVCTLERENATYQVLQSVPDTAFQARVIGNPDLLAGCRYRKENCYEIPFGESALGVGLGAFGNDFDESQGRFGEFLAVAGSAAYLPTDGTHVPDYSLSKGQFVPRLQVLYGIACEGEFSHVVQFERKEDSQRVPLHRSNHRSGDADGVCGSYGSILASFTGAPGTAERSLWPSRNSPMAFLHQRESVLALLDASRRHCCTGGT